MSEIERLTQIPGVGARLAKKLANAFGSENAAIDAILNAQVATIASIPGVGEKTALTIVQEAYRLKEGINPYAVLKTKDAIAIYKRILEIIRSYANSLYAKDKLSLYYPLPPSKLDEIKRRLEWFSQAADLVSKCSPLHLEKLGQLLSNARPLRRAPATKMVNWRVIITDSDTLYTRLKQSGVDKVSRLIRLQPNEKIDEYLRSYDYVIGALENQTVERTLEYAGNFEILKPSFTALDVAPEITISFYAANHDTILSICEAAEALQQLPSTPALHYFLERLNLPALRDLSSIVKLITKSGDVAEGADPHFDRLRVAVRNFEMTVSEVEVWANERIRSELSSSQVVLEGEQVLRILEATATEAINPDQLRRYLPPQVFDILVGVLREAEEKLASLLKLQRNELEWVDGVFSHSVALPIQANRQRINELYNNLRKAMHAREHQLKVEFASKLSQYEQIIRDAVQALLDFDLFQAVGRFARDYHLTVPMLRTKSVGLSFREGRNLFLTQQELEGKLKVVPVSYTIGQTSWKPERTTGERVVLLSGANSGGKSCLLQNVAQIAILAQMGMLVPAAQAEVSIFEELYYYAKAQGMLSAGAFETSLQNLASLVMSKASKLACFDEWEASTEPGAAAKVVAAVLELFHDNPNACVIFVSHLAEDIVKLVKAPVRVDGIEAKGLDDNLNLIVNRSPQFGKIARSTPELIVERLFLSSQGEKRVIFQRILNMLRSASRTNPQSSEYAAPRQSAL